MTEHSARITALFQEQRAKLERFLKSRLGGSIEEAQDVAQEAYMRLVGLRKRREVGNWEALLWCTARNLANNRIGRQKTRQAAKPRMQDEDEDHRTPEISWGEEQAKAAVLRASDCLPQRQRTVFNQYWAGQKIEQIARELGVNERTCRRDLELAIVEIQRMIGLGRGT